MGTDPKRDVGTTPNETSSPTQRDKKQCVGFGLKRKGFSMSMKATKSSRIAAKALAGSNRVAAEARQAADATRLAKDAIKAAIAASCAAERAQLTEGNDKSDNATSMQKVSRGVRSAAEEAVEHARDAMRAESERDVVGAVCSANLSIRAARHASSLAAAASVISGKTKELASEREAAQPRITVDENRPKPSRNRPCDPLAVAIERAARYLVTYDGTIIATFAREEDAFLLESELADLDRAHGTTNGRCEVLERRTGRRLGGYLLTGGKMLVFLRNEKAEARGRRRR